MEQRRNAEKQAAGAGINRPGCLRGGRPVVRHRKVARGGIAVLEAQDHPIIILIGAVLELGAADHPAPVPEKTEVMMASGEELVIDFPGEEIEQFPRRYPYFIARHD